MIRIGERPTATDGHEPEIAVLRQDHASASFQAGCRRNTRNDEFLPHPRSTGTDGDTSGKAEVLMGTRLSRSGYLPINGLNLYHEVYGELSSTSTAPLLLIPGAFMATDSMKTWAEAFAAQRPVIVFDQQGHGRTPDASREMSY